MPEQSQETALSFPVAGMDLTRPYWQQNPRPVAEGVYGRTTRLGKNVRSHEATAERRRGGSRPGLSRYLPNAPVSGWLIQELSCLVGVGYPPPGGDMQTSLSGRVVSLVAVSQGNVYTAAPGDTDWTVATNGTGRTLPLNYTGIVRSTSLNQKLYFADGNSWSYFDPSVNTVYNWNATAGTLPADSSGNLPRLICTWRGRCVMSGILNDPHNWFMSRVGDPYDWNYFPFPVDKAMPVAGNSAPFGLVGDVVTAIIPASDDLLIFGCDHEIWVLRGDPADGGQLDCVTKTIGIAFGLAWAMDPYGAIYFVSNKMGVYQMTPGGLPVRISQPVEQLLQLFNTGTNTIRMIWNDRYQGLHIFVSPTGAPAATTHFFWEQRSGAWWMDQFADHDHDPLCCCTFDGNEPEDRAALIGSWDGIVRSLSTANTTDDGEPISSSVVIGPINAPTLDDVLFKDIQAEMGESSGEVRYAVHSGPTAEKALQQAPVRTGTWGAGRNLTNPIRRAGHALYIKLTSTDAWAMERVRVSIAGTGKARRRGA